MNRGTPLQRRTPLQARTGLTRTPLARKACLRAETPRKAATEAVTRGQGTAQPFPRAACKLIDRRDSDDTGALPVRLCQRCGSARNPHRHHRRGKDAGGSGNRAHTHCPCNAVTLCLECHDWAHGHPRQAEPEGWIVSQAVNEPGTRGVKRFAAAGGGVARWPSCTGEWLDTAPEAMEAA